MPTPGRGLLLALALICPAVALAGAAAQAPRISKPRPAPPGLPNLPPLPPAIYDPTLSVGGEDIKARRVESRLGVDVLVNGRGPYHFVVDSGADTSVVGLRVARALQLPLGTPAVLNGMTDRSLVDRVKVDALTLGPTTVRNLQLPALREDDVGGDGLLGIDALVQQRLMMDFEKHLIKVEDARTRWVSLPGEIVITARRQRGQLILTEVRAAGLRLDAVIDTGSEVTIGNLALRDQLFRKHPDRFSSVKATGVTGVTIDLQMASIPDLRLGPVVINDVPIAFADAPPFEVFGLSHEPALLLGTDILEAFRRVSLDFRARKVRFQLRRCTEDSFVISTVAENTFTRIYSQGGAEVCAR
ncbi:MAG: aspartyl protease family protein [Sphingomonas sp.]